MTFLFSILLLWPHAWTGVMSTGWGSQICFSSFSPFLTSFNLLFCPSVLFSLPPGLMDVQMDGSRSLTRGSTVVNRVSFLCVSPLCFLSFPLPTPRLWLINNWCDIIITPSDHFHCICLYSLVSFWFVCLLILSFCFVPPSLKNLSSGFTICEYEWI